MSGFTMDFGSADGVNLAYQGRPTYSSQSLRRYTNENRIRSRPRTCRPQDVFYDYAHVIADLLRAKNGQSDDEGEYSEGSTTYPTTYKFVNGLEDTPVEEGQVRRGGWQSIGGVRVQGEHDFTWPPPSSWQYVAKRKYWKRPDGAFVCAQPCGRRSWRTPECRKVVKRIEYRSRHDGTHSKEGFQYYCKPYGCLCDMAEGKGYTKIESLKKHLLRDGHMDVEEVNRIYRSLQYFRGQKRTQ